ncbi:MAG: ATP phosphoribosyltransferase [Deltaproteobacteria bacterium]|nr:ATP phosphoribosyltransferase [Deltaproteobacteria bacterium]
MENKGIEPLKLALPKGRMQDGVLSLLADAGIALTNTARSYRPQISLANCEVKQLKPQNVVEMLHVGSRDIGFAGADWVAELGVEVVELLNTELNPVEIVLAAPPALLDGGELPPRRLLLATEYVRLTSDWIDARGRTDQVLRTYGATEVFPPEDADAIVDNSATGSTLAANGLQIVDRLMRSSTRLYANPRALDNPTKRQRIEDLKLLLCAVLDARRRVMLEVNVSKDRLDEVLTTLPCMRQPTIASLANDAGFAVKVAIPRAQLADTVPRVRAAGGTDIVITRPEQIIA